MQIVAELGNKVGIAAACDAFGLPRSSFYRTMRPAPSPKTAAPGRPACHRKLSDDQRQQVLDELHSERFCDKAPRQVYAALLDEGRYLASVRTMYRILDEQAESRERRDQLTHPRHPKPELVARAPNQVWSWDITKLPGPAKWTSYYLYVILDIYSRYVVGWLVAPRESAELASELIEQTMRKQGVRSGELALHADRGTSMTSKTVGQLLADLGVTKTHSRPRVSNDNPYSESQFKTLKYRPDFPGRFGSPEDARAFCRSFFRWYNEEHYHSGIGLMTPAQVHHGRTDDVVAVRQGALDRAHRAHPERFAGRPRAERPASEVWINQPSRTIECVPSDTKSEHVVSQTG